ncbi:hypothetical protein ABOM_000959 [Aspergillus bombycis]|uniref:Indole-diterpene biosynthesis protein PaxU n=1 Tax=Aspergillus bombycis TaxID=109264 RepID=A0A1F8AGH9_9EURO|nr:hypothetical protein ABOM_000959 [Aspergillus bombycis]OGM50428.1 hypothetical protein ABOM_000959 [Aspergillus bombycis]
MQPDSIIFHEIGFTQLGPGVFLRSAFQPGSLAEQPNSTHSSPDVVIICAWAFAHAKHIAKYIAGHQSLYPRAKILLIYNSVANLVWKPDASQRQWFQPAVVVLHECIDSNPDLRVFLHLFSNGGSHSAVQLAEACEQSYPPFRLPITSIVFDSCPSMPKIKPLANSLALGFPSKNIILSTVTSAIAYGIVGLSVFLEKAGLVTHSSTKLYTALNSVHNAFLMWRFSAGETHACPIQRTYIYGPGDTMVTVDQVIQHADIAMANMSACGVDHASRFVTMEEFVGSPHVNHVKFEKERYWRVVKEAWQRSVAKPTEMFEIYGI